MLSLKRIALFGIVTVMALAALVRYQLQRDRAEKLHRDAIVIDTHVDTLQRVLIGNVDLGQRLPKGQVDIPRLEQGGIDAEFFAVWVDPLYTNRGAARRTLQLIDAMYRVLQKYPDQIELALTAADIERISQQGKVAALMGIEGGHAIENDLGLLRMYHRLGVRYMTLTHSNTHDWADASTDKPRWNGLNPFGEEVVREMNRIGMIIDVSHVSDSTFYDVIRISSKPVIASHSSCRALCNSPRNMSDDMIQALAKNGGVIGINFFSAFLDQGFADRMGFSFEELQAPPPNATWKEVDELAARNYRLFEVPSRIPPPPLEKLIDHIDHVVRLVGPNHVGLGSDFDGISSAPEGMEDIAQLPKITKALIKRRYSDEDIKKILGGNFLRVVRQVTGR